MSETSAEERFLGIKAQVTERPNEETEVQGELDIEVIDDTPVADQRVKNKKDKIDYAAVDK